MAQRGDLENRVSSPLRNVKAQEHAADRYSNRGDDDSYQDTTYG
jgi:hypothetical protein